MEKIPVSGRGMSLEGKVVNPIFYVVGVADDVLFEIDVVVLRDVIHSSKTLHDHGVGCVQDSKMIPFLGRVNS